MFLIASPKNSCSLSPIMRSLFSGRDTHLQGATNMLWLLIRIDWKDSRKEFFYYYVYIAYVASEYAFLQYSINFCTNDLLEHHWLFQTISYCIKAMR